MTLKEFVRKYDHDNSIILLEGKRKVLNNDSDILYELGKLVASCSKKMIFRSGNAKGADEYFSAGVASVDKTRLQLIIPYAGHRKNYNYAGESISMDEIDLVKEPEVIYQTKLNHRNRNLIEAFSEGKSNRITVKARYLIRDTVKVIGTSRISGASFGIFYDDPENPFSGGTGHTMLVCKNNKIPFIDQRTWFKWI